MAEVSGKNGYGFLSSEEVLALDRQRTAYGARAKLAFHELGGIIGLPNETSTEMVHALSKGMQELGFDARKQIGDHLSAITGILGGNALQGSVVVTHVDEMVLHERSEIPEQGGVDTESAPAAGPESPKVELSKEVKYWLARLYKEEALSQITDLTQDQFTGFVETLCDRYKILKITRANKELRAAQLRQFLSGESVKAIAGQYEASVVGLRLAFMKIAEGIARMSTPEEINSLIPGYEVEVDQGEPAEDKNGEAPEDEVDLSKVIELTPEQLRWFGTLLKDGGVLDAVRQMNEGQREILINNLGFIFDRATRPSRGNYETDRRLRITREFLKGSSLGAIGETEGLSDMAIGDHLIHVRRDIEQKVDPTILTRSVYDARDGIDYSVEAAAKG